MPSRIRIAKRCDMNVLGLHPFGSWPPWAWVVGFLVGFLAPDWELERRLTARRIEVLMELPTVLDMLTIATSAGLALEQALILVARQGQGGSIPLCGTKPQASSSPPSINSTASARRSAMRA